MVFSPRLDPGTVRDEAVRLVQEELLRATEETARLERERIELERQQQSAVSHAFVYCTHNLHFNQ